MRTARWFWRSPARGLPALVHPGRASGWWWLGERAAWHDGRRLFLEVGERIACLRMGEDVQVLPCPGGLVAWDRSTWLRLDGDRLEVDDPRRARRGADLAAVRPTGALSWTVEGLALPEGAARAGDLTPFPSGRGVIWTSTGYLYRMEAGQRPEALARSGRWWAGPQGAVVVGDGGDVTRGAAPKRPMIPLPCPLGAPIRFSTDGRRVSGVGPEGLAVEVDLVTGAARLCDGVPAGGGGWLGVDGVLEVDGRSARVGLREASFALRGERLAGPGGFVWDLRAGRRLGAGDVGPVQLGATVATGEGFATVDWETGEGLRLDADGQVLGGFHLPLEAEDVVIGGLADGGAAVFETALGRGWRLAGGRVERTEHPRVQASTRPPGWELPVEGEAEVAGIRWGWSVDGVLSAQRAPGAGPTG